MIYHFAGGIHQGTRGVAPQDRLWSPARGEPAVQGVALHGKMQGEAEREIDGRPRDQGDPPAPRQGRPSRREVRQAEHHQRLQADVRQAPGVAGAVHGDAQHDRAAAEQRPKPPARGRGRGPVLHCRPDHPEPRHAAQDKAQVELVELEEPVVPVAPPAGLRNQSAIQRPQEMRHDRVAQVEGDLHQLAAGVHVLDRDAGVGEQRRVHTVNREGPAEPARQQQSADRAQDRSLPPKLAVPPAGPVEDEPGQAEQQDVGPGGVMSQDAGGQGGGAERPRRAGRGGVTCAQEKI